MDATLNAATNWLADHHRWTAAILITAIWIAGNLEGLLP